MPKYPGKCPKNAENAKKCPQTASYQRGGPDVSDHFQSVPMTDVSAISTKMRRLSTMDKAISSLLKCLQQQVCRQDVFNIILCVLTLADKISMANRLHEEDKWHTLLTSQDDIKTFYLLVMERKG
jgi:hypothetical protein